MSELAEEGADENKRDDMTGAKAAAVFLTLLAQEDAAGLLGAMEPDELEQIGESMCALGDVEGEAIREAIASFISEAEREVISAKDRSAHLRGILGSALGDVKAQSMMQRIDADERPRSLEIARWLVPSVTARLIEGEHPQVIAVLLLNLDPENAAQILSLMDEAMQPMIVERIARMGPVSADAIAMLDHLLSAQIGSQFGSAALEMGGPKEAANLINLASGDIARKVIPLIEERDAELSAKIEAEMFTFEMLLDLEPLEMGRLLREVESDALVDALKGLPEEQREPFFASMSSRAADGVRDDIEMRGRVKKDEVKAAQKSIVEIARKLADDGEISVGAGGGDGGDFV